MEQLHDSELAPFIGDKNNKGKRVVLIL